MQAWVPNSRYTSTHNPIAIACIFTHLDYIN